MPPLTPALKFFDEAEYHVVLDYCDDCDYCVRYKGDELLIIFGDYLDFIFVSEYFLRQNFNIKIVD